MSPTVAVAVVTWLAIIVLYLGLAAVLREVALLRAQVTRLSAMVGAQPGGSVPTGTGSTDAAASAVAAAGDGQDRITLPATVTQGRPMIVLMADSSCPLCRVALDALSRAGLAEQPVLLTYESEQAWGPLPDTVRVVRDDAAWSELAHLQTPVLAAVSATGTVDSLALPASEQDIDATLASWGVRAHSGAR